MTKTIAALVSGFLILGALIALVAGPASAQYSSIAQMQESGLPISGGTMLGDINLGGYDLKYVDDIYSPAPTTDVAPTSRDFFSQAAWSRATGGNQTGADIKLVGGIGTRQVTCSAFGADADNDTYTPTVNGTAATAMTAKNGGAGANQFNCITSNAVCCLAFKTLFNTMAGYGATASCIDGTCSNGKVYIDPTAASTYRYTHAIANSAGAVFGSVTSGTDGSTVVSSILSLGPLSTAGVSLTPTSGVLYITKTGSNAAGIVVGQVTSGGAGASAINVSSTGGGTSLGSTGQYVWTAQTYGDATADTGIARTGVGLIKLTNGSTGSAVGFMLAKQEAAVPVEPVACGATTTGTVQYVDDNNDGAIAQICICVSTNDAAYDWVQLNSPGTACGFY